MAWENSGKVNVAKAYSESFGEVQDSTFYAGYDKTFSKKLGMPETMKQHIVSLQKASISDRAAGTAGVVGVPITLDGAMVDMVSRETPVRSLIRRGTVMGKSVDYDRITAKSYANWETENAPSAVGSNTQATKNKAVKFLRAYGNVTGPLFAASKERMAQAGYGDIMNQEVQIATQDLIEQEENALINGNYSVTDAKVPLGILKEILDNGNSTNKTGAGDLSLGDLDEMERIARTAGDSTTLSGKMPNLFLTDFATENKIKAKFYDSYRTNAPTQTWGWGMNSAVINGVPVLGSRFMTAATGSRNLACLNTDYIETRVLQDITYQDLAKTNDSDTFMVKEYLTFVVKAPEFMNLYYNLS